MRVQVLSGEEKVIDVWFNRTKEGGGGMEGKLYQMKRKSKIIAL